MGAMRRLYFHREKRICLQSSRLSQSEKTTYHNKCFFYNFKSLKKKPNVIGYDKDYVTFFFSPGQDLEKNPNTWYDQTLGTIGFMR